MSLAKFKDVDLHYEVHGQGEPLILIAGMTCDLGMWANILENLSPHFSVITFDNRGVGRTRYSGPFSIEMMAEDTLALMDHLKIDQAHMLGHSMGGAIAQSFAVKYPQRLNKLILSHSLLRFKAARRLAFTHIMHLRERRADVKTLTEASAPWIFSDAFLSSAENIQGLITFNQNASNPQSVEAFKAQLAALMEFNSHAWFKKITAPSLVLAGNEDVATPAAELKELAEGIQAEFKLMQGAHVPMIEMPQEYAQVVCDFLKTKPIPSAKGNKQ